MCSDIESARVHPTLGFAVCQLGQFPSIRNDGSLECVTDRSLNPDDLFACVTGMEFYECPTPDACLGGSWQPHAVEYVDPVTWLHPRRLAVMPVLAANSTCHDGHVGVLCSLCETNYVPNKQGMCEGCPSTNLVAYIVAAVVGIGLLLLYTYIDGGSPAAEVPAADSRRGCCCCRRTAQAGTTKRPKMRRTPSLMQYASSLVKGVIEQPDKVMLLVSFMQVMSEFSQTYNVQWPAAMTDAFQVRGCCVLWACALSLA